VYEQQMNRIMDGVVAEVEQAATENRLRWSRRHPDRDSVISYIESAIPRILEHMRALNFPDTITLENMVPRGSRGIFGWKVNTTRGWKIGTTEGASLPFVDRRIELPVYLTIDGELRSSGSTMTPRSFDEVGNLGSLHLAIKRMVAAYSVKL
jgi:hypothetical protein